MRKKRKLARIGKSETRKYLLTLVVFFRILFDYRHFIMANRVSIKLDPDSS